MINRLEYIHVSEYEEFVFIYLKLQIDVNM